MSCNTNRGWFFQKLRTPELAAAFGGEDAATEALELIYDIAVNQSPLNGPDAERQRKTATLRVFARAMRMQIDLYPHRAASTGNMPRPEVQHAWSVIGATLDAIERRDTLPIIAEDVRQSITFRDAIARPHALWQAPLSGALRLALRREWAAAPGLVAALVTNPLLLGSPEYGPFLARMTQALAEGSGSAALSGAAWHYLARDDAEMLEEMDRVRWSRVLAALAGVGVLRGGTEATGICPDCGRPLERVRHECHPADQESAPALAVAVAQVLADPLYRDAEVSGSPATTAEALLDEWMRAGQAEAPPGALGALLDAARAADVRLARAVDPEDGEPSRTVRRRLRDATLRSPLMFEGVPYVWEDGKLYRADRFRQAARWERRRDESWFQMVSDGWSPEAFMSATALARLMAGEPLYPEDVRFRFSNVELAARYARQPVKASQIREEDLFPYPCGCLYQCTTVPRRGVEGELRRIFTPAGGCSTHMAVLTLPLSHRGTLQRVDTTRPTFEMPTWPYQPAEVSDVV